MVNIIEKAGLKIVNSIKSMNIPFVKEVSLDDFGDFSGRIFVSLDMEKMRDSNGVMKYWFDTRKKKSPLRKVSARVRSAISKVKGVKKYNYVSPKRTYSNTYGIRKFNGYDKGWIQFNYKVIGELLEDLKLKREEQRDESLYPEENVKSNRVFGDSLQDWGIK